MTFIPCEMLGEMGRAGRQSAPSSPWGFGGIAPNDVFFEGR